MKSFFPFSAGVATIAIAVLLSGCNSDPEPPAAPAEPAATGNNPGSALPPPKVGDKRKTTSGLQYEVLRTGTGTKPNSWDKVKVHYHGYLPNGTVFDSSMDRGEPIVFGLNQVIPGWTEGVQLMREGAKYRFYIPFHLAYGLQGSPPKIGPKQDLMFDIELIQVIP